MTKNTARAITAAVIAAIVRTARPIFPSLGNRNGVLLQFDGGPFSSTLPPQRKGRAAFAGRGLEIVFERLY
jgi:hypothetical protein